MMRWLVDHIPPLFWLRCTVLDYLHHEFWRLHSELDVARAELVLTVASVYGLAYKGDLLTIRNSYEPDDIPSAEA